MVKRRSYPAKQIITMLLEAEIYLGQGKMAKKQAGCWRSANKPTIASGEIVGV